MQSVHQLVPEFIYQKYRVGDFYGTFQGAAMFADLSGFSTMTDVLSVHGTHGAEVLADMMRVVFEPLVDAVYAQGGFVIGYAGDAFNAIFPVRQDGPEAMKRCLAAAWTMQTHAKSRPLVNTPYGDFPIRIKVGIGFGATTWQIFKSIDGKRASYWFRGQSLNGAVEAEESAHAGEVVADPISYPLLQDVVSVVVPLANYFLLEEIRETELPASLTVSPPKPVDDLVEVFFAEAVTKLPIAGEFRQAVNLFIDIPANISDAALIRPFMETVYLLQEQYGGFFLRPDLGDKGFNLLMFWGAPTAHENDVDRALNFLLELSARTGITLRAGISYRLAYAGFIGSSQREDYTAYGWGVNLAARMMESAGMGEYWMDEETARRAARHFNIKLLGEHKFKGFKQEQKVFTLVGRRNLTEAVYQGQFVGRGDELAALSEFTEPLRRGGFAGVLLLKGEAGIGKSRLVHSFQTSAYFHDFPAYWAVCQTDEILRLPFNPFADWLKKRFELVEGQPEKVIRDRFSRILQQLVESTPDAELAAELARTSSVLAALVNIPMPGSLYESLDAKGRYENTLIALGALLRAESLQKPLVLFLEDTHWLDEASSDFLSHFVRTLLAEKQYPIAMIATQRPEGESPWAADQIPAREIRLDKLASRDLSQLAADILSQPVSDSLLALLDSRAEGNPFFAEQILRYLSEQNALVLDADGKYFAKAGVGTSLPTDVRSVLVARLDRLTRQVREMVQTASVLGREFEVRILGEMLRADREFSSHLTQAENADIWTALSEIAYIFRHALLRDAAYSMQLLARQRELHGLAVSAMETVYRDDLEAHYGELAYHAEKAYLREKALRYLTLAGKLALGVYQNQRAIDYFTRALAFVPDDDLQTRFEILLERAEAYSRVSEFDAQLRDLDVLEELANQLMLDKLLGLAFSKRSHYFNSLGNYHNALMYADKAVIHSRMAQDGSTLLASYSVKQTALMRLGQTGEAVQQGEQALKFAKQIGDRHGEAVALTVLGLIAVENEGPASARLYHEQALTISREIKDRYLEAKILNNLANAVVSLGDIPAAQDYYSESFSIFHEHGDLSGKGLILSNLGWLAGILGNYPAAREYYERCLPILSKIGSRMEEMYAYLNLSAIEIAQGFSQAALDWLEKAFRLSVNIGEQAATGWAYFYAGYAHLLNGTFDLAVQSFLKSIDIRAQLVSPVLAMEARAGLCKAYQKSGNLHAAKNEAGQVMDYIEENRTLEGMEEPLLAFLSVIEALVEAEDPRSGVVLRYATQFLETQVSKLRSQEARHNFVENVPWRRRIQQMAREKGLIP
ncbi:MAG: tetratricopeptide repeat protein [Chloroflexi bacterium]|nr:tetratricopeptide repeat protein [Chloroflexota bacterium]